MTKRFRIRPDCTMGHPPLWGLQYDRGRDNHHRFISMSADCGRLVDKALRMAQNRPPARPPRHVSITADSPAQNLKPFYPEH